jgi:hypothetical protein
MIVAASAALLAAGAPALAQETTAPAQNEVIGPPQLRDFTLNGTVTREAPAPAPVQQQPQRRQAETQSAAERPASASTRPAQPPRQPAATAEREEPRSRAAADANPQTADSGSLPPPTPATRVAAPAVAASDAITQPVGEQDFPPLPSEPGLAASQTGIPILPWLIAALVLVGAMAWYFLRHRPRERYAGAGAASAFDALLPGAPEPAPPVRTPPARTPQAKAPPAAAPPKPSSDGIVSTRLRPWLEVEFKPQRGIVDDQKAAVAFELSVFNSGSVPARDVLLEASLFNAGPMQDQQIRLFFDNPVAKGDRIPVIPPMQRVSISTAVFLPREQVRPIEVEGRQLFVPMIAFNVLYGWTSGKGQTSTSYLIGKSTGGEKLAPFRVDLGPRVFRNLDSREHEVQLRN